MCSVQKWKLTLTHLVNGHWQFVSFLGPSQLHWEYTACAAMLKAVDTIGNCQRLAFTVGVSQHMHKITNLWKFELNRPSHLQDNNERIKHPCHTKLCAFRWLISRPQVLNLRSLKSNSWKITSFSKTLALQREPFLTMFYTINLSPLLVTKTGFMLITILSNYQECPLPLTNHVLPFQTFIWCMYT